MYHALITPLSNPAWKRQAEVDSYPEHEKEEGRSHVKRVVSLDHIKHQESLMEEELERRNKMFH